MGGAVDTQLRSANVARPHLARTHSGPVSAIATQRLPGGAGRAASGSFIILVPHAPFFKTYVFL